MRYTLQFQYKSEHDSRPDDAAQEEEVDPLPGGFFVLPAVGDSVFVTLGPKGPNMYKVLTRHFSYHSSKDGDRFCSINIVVTDMDEAEVLARIRE